MRVFLVKREKKDLFKYLITFPLLLKVFILSLLQRFSSQQSFLFNIPFFIAHSTNIEIIYIIICLLFMILNFFRYCCCCCLCSLIFNIKYIFFAFFNTFELFYFSHFIIIDENITMIMMLKKLRKKIRRTRKLFFVGTA